MWWNFDKENVGIKAKQVYACIVPTVWSTSAVSNSKQYYNPEKNSLSTNWAGPQPDKMNLIAQKYILCIVASTKGEYLK